MVGRILKLSKLSKLSRHSSSPRGFTIVELLIVVVVIGILAAIVTVAYTGIQQRAQVSAITSELKQWHKLFEIYRAANGSYPLPAASNQTTSGGPGTSADHRYCLGTGFPQASGSGYCFVVSSSSIYRVAESTGTYLLSQLSTVGTPPANSAKYTYGGVTGPFLGYVANNDVRLGTIYPPGITCPSGMILEYSSSSRTDCFIRLDYTE